VLWSRERTAAFWFDAVVPRVQALLDAECEFLLQAESIAIGEKVARGRTRLSASRLAIMRTAAGAKWDGLMRMFEMDAVHELSLQGRVPPAGFDPRQSMSGDRWSTWWNSLRVLRADLAALPCVDVLSQMCAGKTRDLVGRLLFSREGFRLELLCAPEDSVVSCAEMLLRVCRRTALCRAPIEWTSAEQLARTLRLIAASDGLVETCQRFSYAGKPLVADLKAAQRAFSADHTPAQTRAWLQTHFAVLNARTAPASLDDALEDE
jgi:hypothetical protein